VHGKKNGLFVNSFNEVFAPLPAGLSPPGHEGEERMQQAGHVIDLATSVT